MTSPIVSRLRIGLLIAVVVVVETSLGGDLRISGVAPELPVLLPIAAGIVDGAQSGAWIGFWSGLLFDFLAPATPIGLHAFTFCLVGLVVGASFESMLQDRMLTVVLVGLGATGASVLLFVGAGDLLGQSQLVSAGRSWLLKVVFVEALWGGALAVLAESVYRMVASRSAKPIRRISITGVLPAREQRVQ